MQLNKGVFKMTQEQITLVRLLSQQIGITTAKQLEEFKTNTKATTNELLIKRLALYVASGTKYNEMQRG